MILHGHQLAASHHYALNLICQQCNELRHLSDVVSDELKRKQARLQKTLELHNRLQQVIEVPCPSPEQGQHGMCMSHSSGPLARSKLYETQVLQKLL